MKRWYDTLSDWKADAPASLHPALEALWDEEKESLWKCYQTTSMVCRLALTEGEAVEEAKHALRDWAEPLQHLKAYAGEACSRNFNRLVAEATPQSALRAFWDLYMGASVTWAEQVFGELLTIGRANEQRIGKSAAEWAFDQAHLFAQRQRYYGREWAIQVCGQAPQDTDGLRALEDMVRKEGDDMFLQDTEQLPWLVAIDMHKRGQHSERSPWDLMTLPGTHSFLKSRESLQQSGLRAALEAAKRRVLIEEAKTPARTTEAVPESAPLDRREKARKKVGRPKATALHESIREEARAIIQKGKAAGRVPEKARVARELAKRFQRKPDTLEKIISGLFEWGGNSAVN